MDSTDSPPMLEARLTPWYYRRMSLIFLMFFGFGCYFAYDWQVGYPKKVAEAAVAMARYHELRTKGQDGLNQFAAEAKEKKWAIKNEATMEPEDFPPSKIQEQLYGTVVCGVVALAVLVFFLRSRGTVLRADGEAVHLPDGRRVPYTAIRRVDTRKWLNKGLASFAFEEDGRSGKGVIDGLKYGGFKGEKPYLPDQILDRVVSTFKGELIELAEAAEEEKTAGEAAGEGEGGLS